MVSSTVSLFPLLSILIFFLSTVCVHSGEDPQSQVVNRSGAGIKRFVMSGKMTSLAHLHRGVATFIQSKKKNMGKSIEDILAAGVADRYGVLDISEDNSFMYSGRTLGFNEFRLFVQSSFFKGNGGHFVQYRALVITKRKTEQARKRSRNGEDYFMMKLPVSCIDNFKKALEMAMAANGMVALPLDEQLGMMGKARMCTATEQALKVYTQELNKELYERQGEERMKEAELAAAAAISAEGEENTGEVAAEEEAAAEEASAESMDDETASITAVAGASETEEMDMIEGELEEDEMRKKKEEKKARYSPISDDDGEAGKKAEEEAMDLAKQKKIKKMSKEQLATLAEELDTDEEFMRELVEKRKQKKKKEQERRCVSDSETDAEMEEKKKKKKEKKSRETVSSDESDDVDDTTLKRLLGSRKESSDVSVDDITLKRLLGSSMYSTFIKKK